MKIRNRITNAERREMKGKDLFFRIKMIYIIKNIKREITNIWGKKEVFWTDYFK